MSISMLCEYCVISGVIVDSYLSKYWKLDGDNWLPDDGNPFFWLGESDLMEVADFSSNSLNECKIFVLGFNEGRRHEAVF